MKKTVSVFLATLLVLCSLSVTAGAMSDMVVDEAHLLTTSEEQVLLDQIESIADLYDVDVIIYTTDELYGDSAEEVANEFYDDGFYRDDAVLLLISPEERYILTNGIGYYAVDDWWLDRMVDQVLPYIEEERYFDACQMFVSLSESAVGVYDDGDWEEDAEIVWSDCLIMAAIFGLVVSLITVLVLRAQLKSVKRQTAANNYVRRNSLALTRQDEMFLYSTTTRTAKPKNTSRSSGGSSPRGGRSF